MSVTETKIDPVLLEIIWNRMITNLEEQAKTLIRTSFSSIVTDSEDLSAGLFDSKGNMIAQANTGTPGHINSMALGVKHFLKKFPKETLKPGDVLIGNNAYEISGHQLDITVVTPAFYKDKLIGYVASTCHVVDIGGRGFNPEGESIYEEGLHIPYLKYYENGNINETLKAIIEANVREPVEVLGDIRAQVVAQEVSIKHLIDMMEEFGLEDIDEVGQEIIRRSEIAMRNAISKIPDGEYSNEIYSDGIDEPIKLKCTVKIKGDELTVDYTGSSWGSHKGINVPLNYTIAYTTYALKLAISPEIPNNDGSFRPVKVIAPEGSVLNAVHPMPTAARHIIGHFTPSCVLGALYHVLPNKVIADGANANWDIQVYGEKLNGEPFSYLFFMNGGMGARANKDGLSVTGFPTGVRGTPVEIVESNSPIVFYQRELRQDSGGAGKYRGGLGQIVRFGVRTNKAFKFPTMFDRFTFAASGLDGGKEGAKAAAIVNDKESLHSKKLYQLNPEDTITLKLPGGGGYGAPHERDPQLVLADVMNGYVSIEKAKEEYLVAIIKTEHGYKIDEAETNRLREN